MDEAQELTDAEWQMLLARCPSRSFTIAGDRAQARHGFTEPWQDRLRRIGLGQITLATLSINYRTPQEVMAEAEPVIRAVLPDANVPASIRSTGLPVTHGPASDLRPVLDTWLAAHADGTAAVIGDPAFRATPRVRSLTPELAKGLEFNLVILINPDGFGTGTEGTIDRYVAMTRATQQLIILTELLIINSSQRREPSSSPLKADAPQEGGGADSPVPARATTSQVGATGFEPDHPSLVRDRRPCSQTA